MAQQNNPPLNQICAEIINGAKSGDATLLEHLLQKYGNALNLDESWHLAIHEAAKARQIAAIQLLIKHGAKVNVVDSNGATALHKAVGTASISFDSENIDVVQCLLANGADPSAKDRFGTTPLHVAARYGQIRIVQLLMESEPKDKLLSNMAASSASQTSQDTLMAASSAQNNMHDHDHPIAAPRRKCWPPKVPSCSCIPSTLDAMQHFVSNYCTCCASQIPTTVTSNADDTTIVTPSTVSMCGAVFDKNTIRDIFAAVFCLPCFVR